VRRRKMWLQVSTENISIFFRTHLLCSVNGHDGDGDMVHYDKDKIRM